MTPFLRLLKMPNRKREKEQRMLKYGARLLHEVIAACDGNICYPIRIFSADEITEAMDGVYRSIKQGFSTDYWATYEDRQILIKSFISDDDFFNEISTVVQLNHSNVVKLLACCFEMESPILMYNLVPNNLHDLLHQANPRAPIGWENRLRIAIEIADAVTYLHIAKPTPIIHRDIKSSNVLLDEHYRPKLCDFSLSVTIPLGETHVETRPAGTLEYLAPECFRSHTVTEKVDVYSFGWLLLELLSGRRPMELLKKDEELTAEEVLEKVLMLIFDTNLPEDKRKTEQWMSYLDLAGRCIALMPDQRPAMKEVALQLREIEKHQIPCSCSASSSS